MAITCLDGTALDERIIKVGIDPGFKQGRQYGRGMSGGQVGGQIALLFLCSPGSERLILETIMHDLVRKRRYNISCSRGHCFRNVTNQAISPVLCCVPGATLRQRAYRKHETRLLAPLVPQTTSSSG